MYVCLCKGLTEADVQRLGRLGSTAPEVLITVLGLDEDDCCGRCARNIDRLVDLATGQRTRIAPKPVA
ncbi:MAG: hypothetical protein HY690_05550 [Chloroflexi bacterium]|nr:hypothetical protein [Chloroflexota bacterium]